MAHFKARYIPKHPQKYMGNIAKIIARSTWEVTVMKFFDMSNSVVRWASEPFPISYIHPVDRRPHKYYVDFYVEYVNAKGEPVKELVEVKPLKESHDDAAKTEYDKQCLAVNKAKWQAATAFANANGMSFRVITEVSMFKQIPTYPKKARAKPLVRKPKASVAKKPARPTTKTKGPK
jgi:hypothetical protein